MKRTIIKKFVALSLAISLSLQLMACGGGTKATDNNAVITEEKPSDAADINEAPHEKESNDTVVNITTGGKGRYVEKVTEMSDTEISYNDCTFATVNGTLTLYSSSGKVFTSPDNGTTWEEIKADALNELREKTAYISELGIADDGTIAISYDDTPDDDDFIPKNMMLMPDGEKKDITLELSEEEAYVRSFTFNDKGELLASVFGSNVYQIDKESLTNTLLFTCEKSSNTYITAQGNKLMCVGYNSVCVYDLDTKKLIEDDVLGKFASDSGEFSDNGSGYDSYAFWGKDENIIYIACESGLYRHVLGGGVMEQVIDGKLATFSSPSYYIKDAIELDNNEFVVAFSNGRIVHYVYDENVSTVPDNKLSVYSLNEIDSIKQAILSYQTAEPDSYVDYEIGINSDAMTREDALKNLNTRLMEGSGPDIIILDDMPFDSYIDKGILLDINDVITELNKTDGLYMNLIEPFYEEDKLYTVPTEFKLPIISGSLADVKETHSYKDIADVIENIRGKNPEGKIIFTCSASGVMKFYKGICAPSWKTENGELNEENIREFLIQSKRIYDAQINGTSKNDIELYNKRNEVELKVSGKTIEDGQYFTMPNDVLYLSGDTKLICGEIESTYSVTAVFSVARTKGFEDTAVYIMNGQSSNVYTVKNMLGVNAKTTNKESAMKFIKTVLGKECQKNVYTGFPINSAAFEDNLIGNADLIAEDGAYSYWAGSDEFGNEFNGVTYWFSEEQKDMLREWISQAKTPYISDKLVEDIVIREGEKYLSGVYDLDTAMDNIMKNAVYMME